MDQPQVYIFSYGSNLLYGRIRDRIQSVDVIDTYELKGFRLLFNKQGSDGSSKANIIYSGHSNHSVWGVIHRMDSSDKQMLDQIERGYGIHTFACSYGTVHAYMSNDTIVSGKPYQWYLNFVLYGALENNFPSAYIAKIRETGTIHDQDMQRKNRHIRLVEHLL